MIKTKEGMIKDIENGLNDHYYNALFTTEFIDEPLSIEQLENPGEAIDGLLRMLKDQHELESLSNSYPVERKKASRL